MSGERRVLVTGATGFVGRALVAQLLADGRAVTAAVRRHDALLPRDVRQIVVTDIGPATDWSAALEEVDAVVHLAARVHQMNDTATDPLAAFRAVNRDGTRVFAEQAAAASVRRFVFVSSVKVNGEETAPGRPYTADDAPAPVDPYGISKSEAEGDIRAVAAATGMEFVIVRPPLVYGPGVRANFRSMLSWVARGVPLPLGGITANRRSLVALPNLVSLLTTVLVHPAAAGQAFLVSDGDDLSTAQLLRRSAKAMGRPARLLPVPAGLLTGAAQLLGRPGVAQRLCGSLQVDITKTRTLLGWTPPVTVDDALRLAAADLRSPA